VSAPQEIKWRDGRREQTAWPAQQVAAQVSEQEAVSSDPARGFEHEEGTLDEIHRGHGLGQRRQRSAQACRLLAEAANPELSALVGHGGVCGFGGGSQRLHPEQTGE
jgi:hypothetical protein